MPTTTKTTTQQSINPTNHPPTLSVTSTEVCSNAGFYICLIQLFLVRGDDFYGKQEETCKLKALKDLWHEVVGMKLLGTLKTM